MRFYSIINVFFKGASGSPFSASIAHIRRMPEIPAYSRLIGAAVIVAQAAQPAFSDITSVFTFLADIRFIAGETVRTVVVSMSPASGSYNRVILSDLSGDRGAVFMDHMADRLK